MNTSEPRIINKFNDEVLNALINYILQNVCMFQFYKNRTGEPFKLREKIKKTQTDNFSTDNRF